MQQRDIQILQEMGLSAWQIRKPDCFPSLTQSVIDLPAQCRLLFVTAETLDEHDAWLFGNILRSMKLTPEQALSLPPHALSELGKHHLIWCWFAGCDGVAPSDCRVLHSESLRLMHEKPASKKALWQQICAFND
ncbi:DNA polymerase III subunit psi [Photobacterium sp. 1_MG-2023]|uniref:DNA polymerase III subunit psi n=1 Tax=Photobacterium sp. 1_MG-2023 TaxID=3062646 RepID=UPI0026E3E316|nr:DNA polymerase III subunit psi [Photobacterium sp. 1_MG-2023]MDO6704737.1 DNA polymerase III subunit psi [Photobacterium sp. 1_MG-2023]